MLSAEDFKKRHPEVINCYVEVHNTMAGWKLWVCVDLSIIDSFDLEEGGDPWDDFNGRNYVDKFIDALKEIGINARRRY